MSQTLCAFLSLFCMFGWVSAGQCAFSDELLLLQEHAHALPKQQKWPDISKIVDELKEDADAASDTVKHVNDTVHNKGLENATSTAIQIVVDTLYEGLEKFSREADLADNTVEEAVVEFVGRVQKNPQLHTFDLLANMTLDAFGRSLPTIGAALNASSGTAQTVLSASGFNDLSEEVGKALKRAMGAINKANLTCERLKQTVAELDAKVNKSAGNLSSEMDKDLEFINKQFHDLATEVNTTFVSNINVAYKTLVDRLHESVEILEAQYLKQVDDDLDTIAPVVEEITGHVANLIQHMAVGFHDAVVDIRENVP